MLKRARVIVSTCRSPWWNLSLEDYVFRHCFDAPFDPKLVLYINDPCVVVGRNQNPWREANLPLLKSLDIPLIRRRSGGGTVVHDAGNVNFSVMMPRKQFSRDKHGLMICQALNSWTPTTPVSYTIPDGSQSSDTEVVNGWIDVESASAAAPGPVPQGPQCTLTLNERFDIVAQDSGKKVSGSAFKIERERAYHHGTMLLNSRLDVLRALLHRDVLRLGSVHGRGTDSVKSPVANIGCDSGVFVTSIINAFRQLYSNNEKTSTLFDPVFIGPETVSADVASHIDAGAAELKSWDWTFGQTPKFSHHVSHPETDHSVVFHVEKGHIQATQGLSPTTTIEPGSLRYTSTQLASSLAPQDQWVCSAID